MSVWWWYVFCGYVIVIGNVGSWYAGYVGEGVAVSGTHVYMCTNLRGALYRHIQLLHFFLFMQLIMIK